jgi:hypothetical protein
MPAFGGMRSNNDWATDQRPKNFREKILYEFPNGDMPLTGLSSMGRSEPTDDPEFSWWTKRLPSQSGTTSVYINVGLSTAYVYATHQATHGIDGAVVYCKVAEALAKEFTKGQTVVLKDTDRMDVDVLGLVVDFKLNGANSYIAVKLLEDDDNSVTAASYNLATVDRIQISAPSHPEGGITPRAVQYDPVKYTNYTQIVRVALEMTRTAKKTRLRTGDQVKEAKREALELVGLAQENMFIYGAANEWIGENGKPQHTTMGLINFIRGYATSGISVSAASSMNDYRYRTDFSGQTWLDGGEDWLDDNLAYLGTYAPSTVVGVCGSGALTGINKLAKAGANINIEPGEVSTYGVKFKSWTNPHITIELKKHPLMSRDPSMTNAMILYSPQNVVTRVFDEIVYMPDRGPRGLDGEMSEFLGEIGYEFHFPDQFMYLHGIGVDNQV